MSATPRHRRDWSGRCARCALLSVACLCADVEPIATASRIVVMMHHREWWRTSNTGRLAGVALTDGHVQVCRKRGVPDTIPHEWLTDRRAVVLFPRVDATPLSALARTADDRPLTLFVPDGTWPEARRIATRIDGLARLPAVTLPAGAASTYLLRSNPDASRLATFEAIMRALHAIEGPQIAEQLERCFELFIGRAEAIRAGRI